MSIMRKIATALRGSIRENAETVINNNRLRIFAQEIYEYEQTINHAKQRLAAILAEKAIIKRDQATTTKQLQSKEKKIKTLIQNEQEKEALYIAQLIADQLPIQKRQQHHVEQITQQVNELQLDLKTRVNQLAHYQAEYHLLKATDQLQSTQKQWASSPLNDIQESIHHIHQQQQYTSDQINAAKQVDDFLNDQAIDEHNQPANTILERIRQQG